MTLLETHLEQIELCANTISELPFPPPGIFTNALLYLPDITALIRDPDSHETALFSVVPPADLPNNPEPRDNALRRSTVFDISETTFQRGAEHKTPRRNNAVAAVLGGDMAERIRRERIGNNNATRRQTGVLKDELDIELLLNGAEKLCRVYPMPGAIDRISALRARHEKVISSIERYETMVAEQAQQLKRMRKSDEFIDDVEEEEGDTTKAVTKMDEPRPLTQEEMKREEESIKELERRKRTLEQRVNGMKRDLGGILR